MPGPTFWGLCLVSGIVFGFALPGAVPVVGGSSDPLVLRSPGVSPQKGRAAMGPATLLDNSPETLFAWCVFFC